MTQRPSDRTLEDALERWHQSGIITPEQASAIRDLERRSPHPALAAPERPRISPATLIIVIGAVLVVVASAVFIGLGWSSMGRVQQFVWATLAVVLSWGVAWRMRRTGSALAVQGSAYLIALGNVALLLFGYTLFRLTGIWPDRPNLTENEDTVRALAAINLGVSAVVAAGFAFRLRLPFMLLVAGSLGAWAWHDLIMLVAMDDDAVAPDDWKMGLYGLFLIAAGMLLARRGLRQHAFWLFLVGLSVAFLYLGIFAFDSALGAGGLLFLLMAIAAVGASLWLEFRVFLLFGALGLYGWVSALIIDTFGGSQIVALLLILVGAAIVLAGLAWQRWLGSWRQRRRPSSPAIP